MEYLDLRLMLYLYILVMPFTDPLFDMLFTLDIGSVSVSIIDLFYFVLTILLIFGKNWRQSSNVKEKHNADNLAAYLALGFLVFWAYTPIMEFALKGRSIISLVSGLFKIVFKYFPLFLIAKGYSRKLENNSIAITMVFSSVLLMTTALFSDLIYSRLSLYGRLETVAGLRVAGFIGLGDTNALAIFSVFVLAVAISSFLDMQISLAYVVIAFFSCFMTVAITASRGGLLGMGLVLLLTKWVSFKTTPKNLAPVLILLISVTLIAYYLWDNLSLVLYRMFESGTTETDLDYRGDAGRMAMSLRGLEFLYDNPKVLLIGDVNKQYNPGGQTVHNWIINSVLSAGLWALAWIINGFRKYFLMNEGMRIIVIVPFLIAALSYPTYQMFVYLCLYLFYVDAQSTNSGQSSFKTPACTKTKTTLGD